MQLAYISLVRLVRQATCRRIDSSVNPGPSMFGRVEQQREKWKIFEIG
jgi:hypothetical protein